MDAPSTKAPTLYKVSRSQQWDLLFIGGKGYTIPNRRRAEP